METGSPPGATDQSAQRLAVLGLILLGWALVVALRLIDLQVFAHEKYVKAAAAQQDKFAPVESVRGAILDRNGVYLAISTPSQIVAVNPGQIQNVEFAAALLSRVLKVDSARLEADLKAAAQSKRHRGYFIVDPHASDQQAAQLCNMKLSWLVVREGSVRTYPNGALAAHVIGNVNSDNQGAGGVEQKLNKDLAGTRGLMRVKVDVKNRAYETEMVTPPALGKTIGLTIDSTLQHTAQEALKQAVIENHAEHGSLVAMNPATGEVLALENYPTYDPNERLHPGQKAEGRENLAVVAPFEPGSVFKVITLSAALETTNLRPESIINCGNGVMTLFSRVIHDHKSYSALSMQDVLAFSSNIGAIRIGMQVGNKNLYEYVRRFGFGRRTGVELPAEAPGLLRPLKRWQPTTIGSIPMGHELSVTSVQLAQAGSVIANGGFLVHPHLIAWEQAPGGPRLALKYPAPARVLKPETVMTMRMMMRRVITEPGGTGHRLHVAGYTIAGKTGTAQIYDFAHRVYTHKYNASFLGYAPIENPSIVVVVTITGTTGLAGYGGSAAGPVFVKTTTEAMRRLSVARDVPSDIDELEAKEKKDAVGKESDDTSLAALNPPTLEEMAEAEGQTSPASNPDLLNIDPNAPKVPNFIGKTARDVIELAAATGIDVDLFGQGLARGQNPAAGALLVSGERIQVRFAR